MGVNVKKYKYMIMSPDQNAENNYNIDTDNKSFERMEEFRYLETTLKIKIPFTK
jgi:hypothetical protein